MSSVDYQTGATPGLIHHGDLKSLCGRDSALRGLVAPSPLDFGSGTGANYFNAGFSAKGAHAIPTAPAMSPNEGTKEASRDGPFERFDSLKSLADAFADKRSGKAPTKQSRHAIAPTTLTLAQLKEMPGSRERNWYLLQKAR